MKKCKQLMNVIEKHLVSLIKKETTVTAVSRILGVSRPTIYRWLKEYVEDGLLGLLDDQPGPKPGKAWNRTKPEIEKVVVQYLREYPLFGPETLKHILYEDLGIKLDATTIRRIGKRWHVKYGKPKEIKEKREQTLYSI